MDKVKKIWMKFVRELVTFCSSQFFFEINLDASLDGALKEMSVLKFVIANGLA